MRAALLLAGLMACACGERAAPPVAVSEAPPTPAPAVLVRQADTPDQVYLEALGGGKLVLRDGCFRIDNGQGEMRLVVWPPRAALTADGKGVTDGFTGTTVMEGDGIVIGGGEIGGLRADGLETPPPEACEGPYWLAGPGHFIAPPEAWSTVRLDERYSFKVEAAMAPADARSALPATFERPGLRVDVSEGDACAAPSAASDATSWSYIVYSDLRMGRVVRERGADGDKLHAVFVDGEKPQAGRRCLELRATCGTARDCDLARSMLSTIRFGNLGQPD